MKEPKSLHHVPSGVSGLVLIQAKLGEIFGIHLADPCAIQQMFFHFRWQGRPVDLGHSITEEFSGNLVSESIHFGRIVRLLVTFYAPLELLQI